MEDAVGTMPVLATARGVAVTARVGWARDLAATTARVSPGLISKDGLLPGERPWAEEAQEVGYLSLDTFCLLLGRQGCLLFHPPRLARTIGETVRTGLVQVAVGSRRGGVWCSEAIRVDPRLVITPGGGRDTDGAVYG